MTTIDPQGTTEPACSFCRRSKSVAGRLIEGFGWGAYSPVYICVMCVKLAQSPLANVAYCAHCKVRNGKHHPRCREAK